MGESDILRVHPVYRACVELEKKNKWGFYFLEDSGAFETAVFINDDGDWTTHLTGIQDRKNIYKQGYKLFVPDIVNYQDKIIIEVEEETGTRRPGAKLARKGHGHEGDLISFRDTTRDLYYQLAGFRVLKIWEYMIKDQKFLNKKLHKFLADCFCKRI